jgi:hypothetical protein
MNQIYIKQSSQLQAQRIDTSLIFKINNILHLYLLFSYHSHKHKSLPSISRYIEYVIASKSHSPMSFHDLLVG